MPLRIVELFPNMLLKIEKCASGTISSQSDTDHLIVNKCCHLVERCVHTAKENMFPQTSTLSESLKVW